jgi:hypothetical protein
MDQLLSVTTQVSVTQVIRHDEDDVGVVRCVPGDGKTQGQEQQKTAD